MADAQDMREMVATREKIIVKTSIIGIATNIFLAAFKAAVGLIYTMNCTEELAKQFNYPALLSPDWNAFMRFFGSCEVLHAYNTYQFTDYSKYMANILDEPGKARTRQTQFPLDKQKAFDLGKRLVEMN